MKKETAILLIVIAFLVGFIAGATVAILRGTKGTEKVGMVQKPQMDPRPDLAEMNLNIKTLKEIVEKDPKNLPALVELGNLYFDSGQPKEAIEAYSRYLAIKPDNPDLRTDMGIMYRALGDFDRAIEEFKKAAQSDPKHINSRYNIGIVLLHDKNDIQGAIKAWEEYLKVDSKSEKAQRVKAQIERMKKMGKEVPKVSK
jgi:tetratricopeptide (TPR) repeat protein